MKVCTFPTSPTSPVSTAAAGESFMDLFEPTETDRRRSNAENDAQEHDPQMDESHSDSGSTSDDDSSSGDSGSDTDPGARRRGSEDGTMEFIFSKNMVSTKQNDSHKVQKTVAGPSAAPGIDDLAMLERRRFMSHRADVVSGTAAHLNAPGKKHKPGNSKADEGTEGLSREDFLKLQREVQLYGESGGRRYWMISIVLTPSFVCIFIFLKIYIFLEFFGRNAHLGEHWQAFCRPFRGSSLR